MIGTHGRRAALSHGLAEAQGDLHTAKVSFGCVLRIKQISYSRCWWRGNLSVDEIGLVGFGGTEMFEVKMTSGVDTALEWRMYTF